MPAVGEDQGSDVEERPRRVLVRAAVGGFVPPPSLLAEGVTGYRLAGEDAHPSGPDEQADDDQDDTPQDLPTEERQNAGHHEYHCENPKNELHETGIPGAFRRETWAPQGCVSSRPRW